MANRLVFLLSLDNLTNDLTRILTPTHTVGGAVLLAEALRSNTSLKTLSIGDNDLGEKGARMLADVLRVNGSLVRIG